MIPQEAHKQLGMLFRLRSPRNRPRRQHPAQGHSRWSSRQRLLPSPLNRCVADAATAGGQRASRPSIEKFYENAPGGPRHRATRAAVAAYACWIMVQGDAVDRWRILESVVQECPQSCEGQPVSCGRQPEAHVQPVPEAGQPGRASSGAICSAPPRQWQVGPLTDTSPDSWQHGVGCDHGAKRGRSLPCRWCRVACQWKCTEPAICPKACPRTGPSFPKRAEGGQRPPE